MLSFGFVFIIFEPFIPVLYDHSFVLVLSLQFPPVSPCLCRPCMLILSLLLRLKSCLLCYLSFIFCYFLSLISKLIPTSLDKP